MNKNKIPDQDIIIIKPAPIFAFLKITPLLFMAIVLLFIAWQTIPSIVFLSLSIVFFAIYRFIYIRKITYFLSAEILKISRGIFFKRTDTVELYRIKDYILTQPFILQIFRLMDLTLKTTDPENPIIWLRGIPLSDLIDTIRNHVQEARQHNKIVEIN